MSDLPAGYDEWRTRSGYDEDPRCEHCGAKESESAKGWRPYKCSDACGVHWRDPDAEYEAARDDPPPPFYADDY